MFSLWRCAFLGVAAGVMFGCGQIERPRVEPFYAVANPPRKQELRWSNGKMPKSFDPARAAAAPETDIIRAVYDGLTDLDSKSLRETPGVAERWEPTEQGRVWTFHLRRDARWTNGERVTAQDFVRSWKRLGDLGDRAANKYLFQNIVGLKAKEALPEVPPVEPFDLMHLPQTDPAPIPEAAHGDPKAVTRLQLSPQPATDPKKHTETSGTDATAVKQMSEPLKFGVEAVDDVTLRVSLELPDKDFPKLVANPIFMPVYGDGANFEQAKLDAAIVTNGAFRIAKIDDDGVSLERSDSFWNRKSVALERVKFVAAGSAEAALEAYKRGDIDVLTNAAFEPLALKLLAPYEDFRQTTHSALNFYEFNTARAPFSDRRVREALSISIDREKLTESDLEGTTKPAHVFFAVGEGQKDQLSLDVVKANDLLDKAGYPGGTGMPQIRLVVNRNDTQQRVARSVARMWRQNLNLDTVVTVKEPAEIDELRKSGDFDILRRGVVLPANDELVNLMSVFGSAKKTVERPATETKTAEEKALAAEVNRADETKGGPSAEPDKLPLSEKKAEIAILTENDAIFELNAMPLYFPTSFSLVKPYVLGFEMNGLDAQSLKEMSIDSSWQPKTP